MAWSNVSIHTAQTQHELHPVPLRRVSTAWGLLPPTLQLGQRLYSFNCCLRHGKSPA